VAIGVRQSVTFLAALGLLPPSGRVLAGAVHFDGTDLAQAAEGTLDRLRGRRIGLVTQDPQQGLNPVKRVGDQVAEPLILHDGLGRRAARRRATELLARVGLPDPARQARAYPHQLSGGQCQRATVAMALACRPDLLIADEPTTALDVTVQRQILDLLRDLQTETGMAMVLITHDLAVVAETCDRVAVMYAGQIVEDAPAVDLFCAPRHPYTRGLLDSLPARSAGATALAAIPGTVPAAGAMPPGCRFAPRCPRRQPSCETAPPPLRSAAGARVACVAPLVAGEAVWT
jgi:oligopeptide/dipeptide ABC transporter, ATP-binding protein, C-terminal domain